MPSSSSSSSDREPTPPPTKAKDKTKGKKKTTAVPSDGTGKNEGPAPNWEYTPPDGVALLHDAADAGEFDWDAVANDKDAEIWLIRVPESIKPKYLENTTLGGLRSAKQSARVGTLDRKHATFDIWSVGEDGGWDGGEQDVSIGGEEIKSLSCLLPRKSKNGTLFPAPRPIARHLVVSAQPAAPASPAPVRPYARPPRESYPKEVLTHSFKPYGSLSGDVHGGVQGKTKRAKGASPKKKKAAQGDEDGMDVDADADVPPPAPAPPTPSPTKAKAKRAAGETAKGKKRKSESVVAPEKRPKKVKTS
ncbi:hypothetical protein C0992_009671 [Termitomyces sp. T32_za158]|nr:hypothetical protein C0992_009671 [Termitomyces sp. T32_za158]